MSKNKGKSSKTDFDKQEEIVNKKLEETLNRFKELRQSEVFPLFLNRAEIKGDTVDDVFDELRKRYKSNPSGRLDVILESGGGSIDSAYNIALLLRRYAPNELNIIVPRWAKSAATVIACAGDKLEMTPIAELGPVDPQITMLNPLEKRLEAFSPLDIDSTLCNSSATNSKLETRSWRKDFWNACNFLLLWAALRSRLMLAFIILSAYLPLECLKMIRLGLRKLLLTWFTIILHTPFASTVLKQRR